MKTIEKGESTVIIFVHVPVPVVRTTIIKKNEDGGTDETNSFRLLKTKIKRRLTKEDILDAFENTSENDLNASFEVIE